MWHRKIPSVRTGHQHAETWTNVSDPSVAFTMNVRLGKQIDPGIFSYGRNDDDLSDLIREINGLYHDQDLEDIDSCPACAQLWDAAESFYIHRVQYGVCTYCGHATVVRRPSRDRFQERFRDSDLLSAAYANSEAAEQRITQIARPKLEWALSVYRERFGVDAETLLDVGAGAGHFVAACQQSGLRAEGWEICTSSVQAADRMFGVDLVQDDFLTGMPSQVDMVTMWGLLEYTPNPRDFLQAAREVISTEGMLILEVPRLDSLSSAIQRQFPNTVIRHLDPSSHLNVFSDTAVVEMLYTCGFEPVSLWLFGMDSIEMAQQLMLNAGSGAPDFIEPEVLLGLQRLIDANYFSDDLVCAAVRR